MMIEQIKIKYCHILFYLKLISMNYILITRQDVQKYSDIKEKQ